MLVSLCHGLITCSTRTTGTKIAWPRSMIINSENVRADRQQNAPANDQQDKRYLDAGAAQVVHEAGHDGVVVPALCQRAVDEVHAQKAQRLGLKLHAVKGQVAIAARGVGCACTMLQVLEGTLSAGAPPCKIGVIFTCAWAVFSSMRV